MYYFFQAEDGIRDYKVSGVQTCALPICQHARHERVRLEVIAVENLDRQQRCAERRAKDGRHASRETGDQENAPLAVGHARSEERREGEEIRIRRTQDDTSKKYRCERFMQ